MSESEDEKGDEGSQTNSGESFIDKSADWVEETDLPLREGAIVGSVSFVITYVLAGIVFVASPGSGSSVGFPAWKSMGWAFYSIHNVSVTPISQLSEVLGGGIVPTPVAYLIPPVVLVGAGYYIAKDSDTGSYVDAASWGATVALGYLPLCFIGVFLTSHTTEGFMSLTISPDFTTAVLLAGVIYPALFGAIGGAGEFDFRNSDRDRQRIEKIAAGIGIGIVILAVVTASLAGGGGGGGTSMGAVDNNQQNTQGSQDTSDNQNQDSDTARAGVNIDIDEVERTITLSVVTMDNSDYVEVRFSGDVSGSATLNQAGDELTLDSSGLSVTGNGQVTQDAEGLSEGDSGTITIVAVIEGGMLSSSTENVIQSAEFDM